MFDDEIELYQKMSDDELLARARLNDYRAVATLLERLMRDT